MDIITLAVLIVFLGLVFDYTNGFHDAANVVATVIATRVLKPVVAILMAGVLNTIGALQISKIVHTISFGLVESSLVTPFIVLSALLGAIFWNLLTWYFAMPSSSSYALIGALLGASLRQSGTGSVLWMGLTYKVLLPMIISPMIGFSLGYLLMRICYRWASKKEGRAVHRIFSHLQIGSASIVALAHGLNDAQKSMGIITLGLFGAGVLNGCETPFWVILACAIFMGLGTASGGMRIIRTVGFSITKLEPMQGFVTELSASLVILSASFLGMPISSTHMIVGSVTGVGSAHSFKAIDWFTIRKLIFTWVVSIPGAACVGALFLEFVKLLNGYL